MGNYTREQLLNKLHDVPFCAIATVVTEDMGLQYDYISSEGSGTGFGGMGRWPAYVFAPIPNDLWHMIRGKLNDGSLRIEDLDGTELKEFAEDLFESYYGGFFRDIELLDMMSGLKDLPESISTPFYCLFDMGDSGYANHRPVFYATEGDFIEAFIDTYCSYFDKWEEMDTEDLENWWERIEDGEFPSSFPYLSY